jgi:hypothetical protein
MRTGSSFAITEALHLDGKNLHPGTHAHVTRFNRFLPLASDTTDTEEEEDSDDEDRGPTAHPPAKTPYAPPKSLQAMEGSNQTPYEPASHLGAMEGSSSIQIKATTTRPTRPYVSRDGASINYCGIPIAGEYDDDYSDDSWSSEDNKLPSHLPDHDGDVEMQMESSNGRLRKLSKGQRQRRNRSLKKVKMERERADFNRTLRHELRHDPPPLIPPIIANDTPSHTRSTATTHPATKTPYALPRSSQATEGSNPTPYELASHLGTMEGSSSIDETPTTSTLHSTLETDSLPTLRPRAAWMIDEGDERTEAQADADWHRATRQLLGHPRPAPYILPSPAMLPNPKEGEVVNRWHHCLPLPGVMPHPTDRTPFTSVPLSHPSIRRSNTTIPADPSLGSTMVSLSHPFALNEPIHYMTWGLQAGIVTAIYLPGEGYNPSDGLETLYLISRPHASPLLVPAHLMRKIPLGASLNPIQEPADTASATAWKLEYTTEEDDEDDRACFSQDWLTQQIEDADLQMIDHWGSHAVELLVADPQHRVARHHIHTTLIHFSDHRLLVFRTSDVRKAHARLNRHQPLHQSRKVQDPDPDDMQSYPSNLLAESYQGSHFSGGHAVTACTYVRDPTARFPDASLLVHIAVDTYSDISVASPDIAYDITEVTHRGHSHRRR